MILMTGQRGATCEGFLTVGIRTLVGSFAGVDSSMPRQRTRIAERLEISCQRNVKRQGGLMDTHLPTPLAHMRFLPRMYTRMYSQS